MFSEEEDRSRYLRSLSMTVRKLIEIRRDHCGLYCVYACLELESHELENPRAILVSAQFPTER